MYNLLKVNITGEYTNDILDYRSLAYNFKVLNIGYTIGRCVSSEEVTDEIY